MKLLFFIFTAIFVATSTAALQEGEDPSFRCSFCQSVVNVIERGLPKGSTPEEKVHFVRGLCGRMPPLLQSKCDEFMDAHGDDIARLVTEMQNNEKPLDICGQLGLCRSAKEIRAEQERTTCPQCMAIVDNLEHSLPKGATLQEKRDFLRGVCGRLPSLLQSPCDKFLNTYGERVLELLQEMQDDVDPRIVCAQLDLCPAPHDNDEGQEEGPREDERRVPDEKPSIPATPTPLSMVELDWRQRKCVKGVMCEVCKYLIGELEDHVMVDMEPGNCTMDELESYVLNLCEYVPPCHQGACQEFMKQYAYPMIDVLYNTEHKEHPGKICAMMDVCPRTYLHCKPMPPKKMNPEHQHFDEPHDDRKVIPDRPLPPTPKKY